MKPVLFRIEARLELEEAVAYYESRRVGLGADFREKAEAAVGRISETPERWSPLTNDTRRFLLRRFPYSIVYTMLPTHILIIAVAHQKRRPGYWSGRIARGG